VFWRRKPRDEDESAAGETPKSPVDGAPEGGPELAPDWEPDPADFGDPAPASAPAPSIGESPDQPPAEEAAPEVVARAEAPAEASAYPGWPAAATESVVDPGAAGEGSLEAGVARSRGGFVARLRGLLGGGPAGGPSWDEVEETLIGGDVGAALAIEIVERARARHDPAGSLAAVRAELAALLAPRDPDWRPLPAVPGQPAVVLVVGVNGTGKTTTIGKLASRFHAEGLSVILAAADTFRAAAIEQLGIWATRSGSTMIAHAPGADPGAVVYDALDAAVARQADMVIADTAGRLHTKVNLMDELAKVRRIIDKRLPGARPEVLFVLDATTGQNGLAQARAFNEATGLTGIVLTKLDSTAKGGIVFAIEADLGVPVRFVGVGEQVADLLPFDPEAFVAALFAE
jgi:fused signal recognition particle receptor